MQGYIYVDSDDNEDFVELAEEGTSKTKGEPDWLHVIFRYFTIPISLRELSFTFCPRDAKGS